MTTWIKWLCIVLVVPAALAGSLLTAAWISSEQALRQRFVITDPPLPPASGASIEHGRHLYESRGCSECHGQLGEGTVVFDAPPMRKVGSNLTPAGAGRHYDADAFGRAIRHGVGHDGRSLLLMPVQDYAELSDADTAALATYLLTLAPVEHDPGSTQIWWLGRVLHLFGQIDLVPAASVDHRPRARVAPPVAASIEYGQYLAHTCSGCHGSDYRGGRVNGTPPDFPAATDLARLSSWSLDEFRTLMREGRRPDARALHPLMPWQAFRSMTDDELAALWLYFGSLG